MKSKIKPGDIDIALIFREENYKEIDRISYAVKKIGDELSLKLHIEPLIVDNLHKEPLYLNLIHEGYSVKFKQFLSKNLKTKSVVLITYSLKNLTHSKKTLFGYALKGREGKNGILQKMKGEAVGRNNILAPVEKLESFREFLKSWEVNYKMKRVLIIG